MGTAIIHHLLLTSLQVNVSHIPLKIFLSPLTSYSTVVSGQMALLRYIAQQGIAVREKQAQPKPTPGVGEGKVDPTLESDNRSTSSKVQHKQKLNKTGLTLSKKDQLEAESSKSLLPSALPQDPPEPPRAVTPLPPPPLPTLVGKHSTPMIRNTQVGGSMATLMAQL